MSDLESSISNEITPPAEPAHHGRQNPRDVQYAGLQALQTLYPQKVDQAEEELRQEHERETQRAERRHERLTRKLQSRYQRLIDIGDRRYAERTQDIQTTHADEMARIDAKRQKSRAKVMKDAQDAGGQVKEKLDQELWLADNVVEATKIEIAKQKQQLDKDTAARHQQLNDLLHHAHEAVEEFRVKAPTDAETDAPTPPVIDSAGDGIQRFKQHIDSMQAATERLANLGLARMYRGATPGLMVFALGILGAVGGGFWGNAGDGIPTLPIGAAIGFGIGAIATIVLGFALRGSARTKVLTTLTPIRDEAAQAHALADAIQKQGTLALSNRLDATNAKRNEDVTAARSKYEPKLSRVAMTRKNLLQSVEEKYAQRKREIDERRDLALKPYLTWPDRDKPALEQRRDRYIRISAAQLAEEQREIDRRRDERAAELHQQWSLAMDALGDLLDRAPAGDERLNQSIEETDWPNWQINHVFLQAVRFGRLDVDFGRVAARFRDDPRLKRERLERLQIPAMLGYPQDGSLLIEYTRDARERANEALHGAIFRILTSIPPGRANLTLIDPVGLGNRFAGFMHLGDYKDALVGGRIWTDKRQIDEQLADLSDHMENVIQKYLRNEFSTIDEYNAQAGELAEPYRFLVIADFPSNFSEEALRRLAGIVANGARCGVYTLITRDRRLSLPQGADMRDYIARGAHLFFDEHSVEWKDEVLAEFPLTIEPAPDESVITDLMHKVGTAALESGKVEVPFDSIAPESDDVWTRDSGPDLQIPIGRSGATRTQSLTLGKGVAQHVLIAGKTGSGKSSLLHAIITSAAMWYSPQDVEFYLVDFKKGVEFKTYATHALPHARAIAIESDREFGLSVLQKLDDEMNRRGEVFRRAGVQDLTAYRATPDATVMPRTLLIIDEFQIFFTEDDKLAQDAATLLDRLVRQGRAFGMHVILGSQTLGGAMGLARSTMGQMAVRIALQCSEADSQLILDDTNPAARLLSRPGEAIYNDGGGLVENNSPFQTAWLPDRVRDEKLNVVSQRAKEIDAGPPPIVFEGSAPGDLSRNPALTQLLASPPSEAPREPVIWLGEAIEIKDPTAIRFGRQSGANALIVGQNDDAAAGIVAAAITALHAQTRDATETAVYLFNGAVSDDNAAGIEAALATLGGRGRNVSYRETADALHEIAEQVRQRQANDALAAQPLFVVIHALQKFRALRKRRDEFGLSMASEDSGPNPAGDLGEILREGPTVGVHVITWCDTPTSVDRTFDRATMGEFDHRVLFQMSASDSSNLIDSPAANRLGPYRGLYYSEEQGVIEKFRPYAVPDGEWLEGLNKP